MPIRIALPIFGNLTIKFRHSFDTSFFTRIKIDTTCHRAFTPTIFCHKKWIWKNSKAKDLEKHKGKISKSLSSELNNLSMDIHSIKGISQDKRNSLTDDYNNLVRNIQSLFKENISMVDSDQTLTEIEESFKSRIQKVRDSFENELDKSSDDNESKNIIIQLPLLGTFQLEVRHNNTFGGKATVQLSDKRPYSSKVVCSKKWICWNQEVKKIENGKENFANEMTQELNKLSIAILTNPDINQMRRNELLKQFNDLKTNIKATVQQNFPFIRSNTEIEDRKKNFIEQCTQLHNELKKKEVEVVVPPVKQSLVQQAKDKIKGKLVTHTVGKTASQLAQGSKKVFEKSKNIFKEALKGDPNTWGTPPVGPAPTPKPPDQTSIDEID